MARWKLALMFVVVAAACTSTTPPPPQPSDRPPGGTLRVGLMSSDDEIGGWCPLLLCGHTFDPQSTSFVSNFELDRCCFMRTLMSYSGGSAADGGTVPRPDVATAPPAISTDGLTWTFHLRSGLRYAPPFEDTEIVAADFIRSLERAFTPASNDIPWAAGGGTIGFYWTDTYLANVIAGVADFTAGKADHVSGLEAPDPHTLVVHLLQPTGDLASRLALPQLGPIPANPAHPDDPLGVAQGHDFDYGDVMVSSGPYMFEGSERLTYLARPEDQLPPEGDGPDMATLVRNPSWSPRDDPIRRAWADRIELFPIASPREGETKLRNGALDVVLDWGAEAGTVTRWLDDPALRHRIEVSPADGEDFLVLNVAVPPLDDLHVRRAMALSVNRVAAASALEGDGSELGRRVLTHLALDSYEDNLLLSYEPPGFAPEGDPDAAAREMALSRYDTDHDGQCDANVCSGLELLVDRTDAPGVAAAEQLADDLGSIGLGVDVTPLPSERMNNTFGRPALHQALRMSGWFKDYPNASTFFPVLLGSDAIGEANLSLVGASPEQLRRYGYTVESVPSVDDRIAACSGLVLGAQTRCWAALDQFLTEQLVPWISLAQREAGWPSSRRVQTLNVDASIAIPLPALDNIQVQGPPGAPSPVPPAPAEVPTIPDGVYRFTVSIDDIVAAGGAGDDDQSIGTYTVELGEGWFRWRQRSADPLFNPVGVGTYEGSGDRVTLHQSQPYFNALDYSPLTWRLQGTSVVFEMERCTGPAADDPELCAFERALLTAHPWELVDLDTTG